MKFMEGYKTYSGIVIMLLSAIGVGSLFGDDNVAGIINTIGQLVGFVLAAYGRYSVGKTTSSKKK